MTRPRAPYVPPVPDEDEDIHPAELRRLEKLFFARVDHLIAAFERKRRAARLDADPLHLRFMMRRCNMGGLAQA